MKTIKKFTGSLRFFIMKNRYLFDLIIPIIAFLSVHIPQIFSTGFYHDDWNLFVKGNLLNEKELIHFLRIEHLESRPIQAIAYYVIDLFWDGKPESLAIISSMFVATSAICLHIFLMRILKLANLPSHAASIATTAWILIPWGLGYSLWVTGAVALCSQILFLSSSILFLSFAENGKYNHMVYGSVLLIFSYLSYEAYYFAFVGVLAVTMALGPDERNFRCRSAIIFIACSLIQIIMALYTSIFTPKNVSIDISFILRNIVYYLPRAIGSVFYGHRSLVLMLGMMILITAILGYFLSGERKFGKYTLAITACGLAVIIGTVPFSVASYGIEGIGTLSRTTVTVNMWLAVLLCLLVSGRLTSKFLSGLRAVSVGVLLGILATATTVQIRHWADSWNIQQDILNRFPVTFVETLPKSSIIVFDSPRFWNGVEIFAAPWDITNAVYKRAIESGWHGKPTDFPQIVPFYSHFSMRWDGHDEFTITAGWTKPAKQVWEYNPSTNRIWRIRKAGPITTEPLVD